MGGDGRCLVCKSGLRGRPDTMLPAKLRLAQAAIAKRDTKVGELCAEWACRVRRSTGSSIPWENGALTAPNCLNAKSRATSAWPSGKRQKPSEGHLGCVRLLGCSGRTRPKRTKAEWANRVHLSTNPIYLVLDVELPTDPGAEAYSSTLTLA